MRQKRWALAGVAALVAGVGWFGADAASAGRASHPSVVAAAMAHGLPGRPAASAAAATSLAAGSGGPAGQTLAVVTRQVAGRLIDLGKSGDYAGDFFIAKEKIYDSTGQHLIGVDSVRCELGIGTFTCEATIMIDGKGKIRIAGTLFSHSDNSFPVTGGTGAYQGVGGQLSTFDLRGGATALVFHLVR